MTTDLSQASGEAAAIADAKPKSRLYAHYVLGVLCLANVLNVADRNIMGLLLEPIKADLHASDTAMSLLTGASFVLFYALFGVPIARWSDRGDRRTILALGVAVWSLMTAACGLAGNFAQMAVARAGVGVGEAAGTPTSMSLIADYYEKAVRPQMIALFNMAIYIGAVLVTPMIGIVTDLYSWRTAFIVVGLPGVAVALLIRLTVREPKRGGMETAAEQARVAQTTHTTWSSIKTIFSSRPFVLILLGTAITGLGAGTLGAWGPALMMRAFHVSATHVAAVAAPLMSIAGIAGTMLGGYLTSYLVKRRKSERWLVLAPALVSLPTIIGSFFYAWAPSFGWMVVGGMIGGFTIGYRTSPYLALALNLVPANCRGMAMAANVIASSVVGMAGGPLLVGMISDYLSPTYGSIVGLRYGFIVAPITLTLGVIPFFMALRCFDANGVKKEYAI